MTYSVQRNGKFTDNKGAPAAIKDFLASSDFTNLGISDSITKIAAEIIENKLTLIFYGDGAHAYRILATNDPLQKLARTLLDLDEPAPLSRPPSLRKQDIETPSFLQSTERTSDDLAGQLISSHSNNVTLCNEIQELKETLEELQENLDIRNNQIRTKNQTNKEILDLAAKTAATNEVLTKEISRMERHILHLETLLQPKHSDRNETNDLTQSKDKEQISSLETSFMQAQEIIKKQEELISHTQLQYQKTHDEDLAKIETLQKSLQEYEALYYAPPQELPNTSTLREDNEKLRKELEELRNSQIAGNWVNSQANSIDQTNLELHSQIGNLQEKNYVLTTVLNNKVQENEDLRERNRDLQNTVDINTSTYEEVDKLNQINTTLTQEKTDLENKLTHTETQRAATSNENTIRIEKNKMLEETMHKMLQEMETLKTAAAHASALQSNLDRAQEALNYSYKQSIENIKLSNKNSDLNKTIEQLREQIQNLQIDLGFTSEQLDYRTL